MGYNTPPLQTTIFSSMEKDEMRSKIYAIVMGILRDMKAEKIRLDDVKREFCKRFDKELKAVEKLSDEEIEDIVKCF